MIKRRHFSVQKEQESTQRQLAMVQEAFGIILLCLGIFLLLTLLSHNPEDPSFNYANGDNTIHNLTGKIGAYLSDALIQAFGFASGWLVFFLLFPGYKLLRHTQQTEFYLDRLLTFPTLALVTTILLSLLFGGAVAPDAFPPTGPGGVLGFTIAAAMQDAFGISGTIILLIPILILSLMILLRISFSDLIGNIKSDISNLEIPQIGGQIDPPIMAKKVHRFKPMFRSFLTKLMALLTQLHHWRPFKKTTKETTPANTLATNNPETIATSAIETNRMDAPTLAQPDIESEAIRSHPVYLSASERMQSTQQTPIKRHEAEYTQPKKTQPSTSSPPPPPKTEPIIVEPIEPEQILPLKPVFTPPVEQAIQPEMPRSQVVIEPEPAPHPKPAFTPSVEPTIQPEKPQNQEAPTFPNPFSATATWSPPPSPNLTNRWDENDEEEENEINHAPPQTGFARSTTPANQPETQNFSQPPIEIPLDERWNEDLDEDLDEDEDLENPVQSFFHDDDDFDEDQEADFDPMPTITPRLRPPFKDLPPSELMPEMEPAPLPPLTMLGLPEETVYEGPSRELLTSTARLLEQKLEDFKIKGQIIDAHPGPVITTYELDPAPGLRAAKVVGLADDLARSISAVSVRVVGNIPGKNVIGIEIPNKNRRTVYLRDILDSDTFRQMNLKSPLAMALGSDINGNPVVGNLAKMPHLLVAGTTGSGKSVAVNCMICSILFTARAEDVRFLMVDPKMLELSIYEGIPHLLAPVVTDVNKAAALLKWAVSEMEDRYRLMSELGVRGLTGYNQRIQECLISGEEPTRRVKVGFDPETGRPVEQEEPIPLEKKPLIVIVIDELADLMIQVGKEVEPAIARLAQMARAAGLHLIIATQRPSVDVITGLIKANFPTRLAFQVSSKIDSRTILDAMGADRLLGMGDGLFQPPGTTHLQRIHAPFVSDSEVHKLVNFLKATGRPEYNPSILAHTVGDEGDDGNNLADAIAEEYDPLYDQAAAVVVRARKVSTSMVQRHFKIGYNRAARIVERMALDGLISEPNNAGKREVLTPNPAHQ